MANIKAALRYIEEWKPAAELKVSPEESKFLPLSLSSLHSLLPAGLQRGAIAEISGPRSAGRTALCWHMLAQATMEGEICAVVDTADAFDPLSAASAGIHLQRLVWVRCGGNLEYAFRAVDLLLHAGGFGVINLDLCETNPRHLNRIPLSYWHRFRRALEDTAAVLLVCADQPQARSCASTAIQSKAQAISWRGVPPFSRLTGLEVQAVPRKILSIRPQPLLLKASA